MIRTSNYTNLTASITGRGKRGLFALGEVAQKKLYTAEHIPSSPGERGLIFPLLPLPHAAVGIPPNFSRMAHSAAFRIGHHHTTGNQQASDRRPTWAASACGSLRRDGIKMANWLKSFQEIYIGPSGANITAHHCTNYHPATVHKVICIRDQAVSHQGKSRDE
jgi:hypothetical protein